jgi:hypothetical protein
MLDENDLLQRISDVTAAETGSRFFREFVKNIGQALGTYGSWITEYLPDSHRLRTLAFQLGGGFLDHYKYDIVGAPGEASLKNNNFLHLTENVVELFPGDFDLAEFAAVSCMGRLGLIRSVLTASNG